MQKLKDVTLAVLVLALTGVLVFGSIAFYAWSLT
jgi:hypothetical protein